jgi:hypothetical protein
MALSEHVVWCGAPSSILEFVHMQINETLGGLNQNTATLSGRRPAKLSPNIA